MTELFSPPPPLLWFQRGVASGEVAIAKRLIPPPRATESYAQSMFQLAKNIRLAAGGPNASVSIFDADAPHGPTNANLHFAAFQVRLGAVS